MNIEIRRYRIRTETIDGQLFINGSTKICDTAENALHALPAGDYKVHVCKCKRHARKMPIVCLEGSTLPCDRCKKLPYTGFNTTMPIYCPMLTAGNGVYNRNDGAILLGEYIAPGCLKHPKDNFDRVYEMIRKAAERNHQITLTIKEP